MNNPEEQKSFNDPNNREVDDYDEQLPADDSSSSVSPGVGEGSQAAVSGESSRRDIGLAARLTDLFVGDGDSDGDLLMQRSNDEGTVMQWLQALDMQVIGACRADERLKPLLKLNVSGGVAEDRLLSHLSQHFEPSEVGLLARCLCIPLVSIRVGKINKQGTLLIPTSVRGNLTLSLLPTSDLRMSFIGDDGHMERLSTLRNASDCSAVAIEGIAADACGRSFEIRVPSAEPLYFWCSEKSRLLGNELLEKMKNLLERKPSLAELTGISDSRLQCFVAHLRTYLVGTNPQVNNTSASRNSTSTTSSSPGIVCQQSASLPSKPSRPRSGGIQGSLSPRSSSFKEGPPRNLASLRTVVKDKLRRRGDGANLSCVENFESFALSSPSSLDESTSNQSGKPKLPELSIRTCLFPSSSELELESAEKAVNMASLGSEPPIPPIVSSLISPYYCWCPPIASTLQYTVAPLQLKPVPVTESFTLPPLSSLLAGSASRSSSSLLTPKPALNLADLPPFLPEPLVRLQSLSVPASQQIPTFTPLMCDPIVHIPVIDVCSSGQAYLVSGGPAMTATIPPLHQTLVSPLIQESDSIAEKSARDTLRMLISGSSQLPSVLANTDGNQNTLAGGSRGLYCGATDVNSAIANSIAAMSLVSLSERSGVGMRRCLDQGDLVDLLDDPVDSDRTCSSQGGSSLSDTGEGTSS